MSLISDYDAALFDLDGVIYLGPEAIPGVSDAISELRELGCGIGFVTNNAARTPSRVAQHLRSLGIVARDSDVVNSTMATLRMLAVELTPGAKVLPVGSDALAEQLGAAGYQVVTTKDEQPDAVVQGYDPNLSWPRLEEGVIAIQSGARWFVTNPDPTRPSERGIVPGCGAQSQAVRLCVTQEPAVAGKPFSPLLLETIDRVGSVRPIFVGDRLDTDILGANNVGIASLFVFTGAHGKHDLLAAEPSARPTTIGWDVAALLAPRRAANIAGNRAECSGQVAAVSKGKVHISPPTGREEQLNACWAALSLAWQTGADATDALISLGELP